MSNTIRSSTGSPAFQVGIPSVSRPSPRPARPVQQVEEPVTEAPAHERYAPPSRAVLNSIPGNAQLFALVQLAKQAVRHGVFWRRGTILNLLT